MRCKKQYRFHKIPISCLWEVHLDKMTWSRICTAANTRKCTFTWITRYCVFRLVRKVNINIPNAMKIHSNKAKETYQNSVIYHRHLLCLYGDDEKLIRITAMQLGITVSHLIRLALQLFLPKIENFSVYWIHIFYHGTKICRFLDISRKNMLQMPFYDVLFYGKWSKEQWYKRPIYGINIPFTPDSNELQSNPIKGKCT